MHDIIFFNFLSISDFSGCSLLLKSLKIFTRILGTLSIDNETDDDDASQPRQTGPRVSFSAGKTKFKQCSFPDRRRLFLCEELCHVTACYGIQRPP